MVREPLLHFLLAGALVFVAFGFIGGPDRETREITVTRQQVEQLAATFARTWQRPATEQDMKALIDDYVKEEIYVREALRLGLDQDDTVIRRRLRQKMEFMEQAEAAALTPAPGELEAYFENNKATFEREPKLALQQVYIDPRRHGDAAEAEALDVLRQLRANAGPPELGDATMLPPALELSPPSTIAAIFGPAFAEKVVTLTPGEWSGPVKSEFGLHIVRITERENGSLPALEDIREAVTSKWREAKQAEVTQRRFDDLLKSYDVRIDGSKGNGAP
jgi:hypothetical protein